ncbi:ankyrin repeat domain-containing protein [Cardinium endosymbiont of Culicoides punctatus]|uniref:ankyrin repeat domain-containing protein n=1 Tax=Cardinium endosymbiont of Culicoides punctatus TaxID=2304601 RepID=UPI001058FF20|nr:ankyrin repeat domain-containing protein [Cardinium endosymbiont of Culicoides punctatus]TDG95543.1 hypothetical protein CCPUN_02790 [Cardinium endosymbiont of Culicoides punctatus]
MNNSQTAIFFIKCTQIASACLMLLTVSCAKRNDQYGTKHKLTQDQQQQNMIYSKCSPKRIKFTPQDQYNKLLELLNDEKLEDFIDLLRFVPDINFTDNNDQTLLHHAVKDNQPHTTEVLLKKNANIYAKSKDGMTPIDIAKINNNPDIESMLLKKHNNIIQSFHKAIRANKLKQVQKLLSQGCDVNAPDINGMTPLILATKFGYWNIFQELLKVEGINIYHTDNQVFDAFYYAGIAKHCYPSFYNLLEEQKNKKEHRKA